jgi:hypothetical protein
MAPAKSAGTIFSMADAQAQFAHDMLAANRGVSTALTENAAGAANRNLEFGLAAYQRGPAHSIVFAGIMAARRFQQLNDVRQESGATAIDFPRDHLLDQFRLRTDSVVDGVAFVELCVESPLPELDAAEEIVRKHGLPGFMMVVQAYNHVGVMLVEADPAVSSLKDLMAREAVADEVDWLTDYPDQ